MNVYDLNVRTEFKLLKNPKEIVTGDIAVVFSGHLRSFRRAMPTTIRTLRMFGNVHLYIHTWSAIDKHSDGSFGAIDELIKITSKAKLCGLLVSSALSTEDDFRYSDHHYMYYSMWMASKLKQEVEEMHLKRYVRCIKTRPDVAFSNIFIEELKSDKSYFYQARTINSSHTATTDLASISDSITLDRMGMFLSKLKVSTQPAEARRRFYTYISKTLHLLPSRSRYLSDWHLIRNDGSVHIF